MAHFPLSVFFPLLLPMYQGADAALRCRWTDMNAMHYAVYFDAAETVRVLAEQNPSLVMSTCSELSNGNCLHLAAANLSLEAGKVLVSRNLVFAGVSRNSVL